MAGADALFTTEAPNIERLMSATARRCPLRSIATPLSSSISPSARQSASPASVTVLPSVPKVKAWKAVSEPLTVILNGTLVPFTVSLAWQP